MFLAKTDHTIEKQLAVRGGVGENYTGLPAGIESGKIELKECVAMHATHSFIKP